MRTFLLCSGSGRRDGDTPPQHHGDHVQLRAGGNRFRTRGVVPSLPRDEAPGGQPPFADRQVLGWVRLPGTHQSCARLLFSSEF